MSLKTLLLLKLVCCGGPLLVFVLASIGLSGVTVMLPDGSWYLVGIAGALTGVLLWRFGRHLAGSCPDEPETETRLTSSP